MNISEVLTRVKLQLGLFNIATPFENLDEVLTTIIKDITIPTFSLYCPVREKLHLNMNDLERIEKTTTYTTYLLPDFRTRDLLYVFDVYYDTQVLSGLGLYGDVMPTLVGGLSSQMMVSNAGAHLADLMIPKPTFEFIKPRKLTIYNNYASAKMVLELGFSHDKTMASIPETARESFITLAALDVKMNLYPTIKQYTEINTAIGNINLKIDDWQQADDERKALLDKWDDTYHIDFKPITYG